MFEAPYGGFCTTFSRSQDRFDRNELSAGLGRERFETMGIALKLYSCVGSNHTTLDAIRDIAWRRPFAPGYVERIVVHGSQVTVDHVGLPYRPGGLTAAQLNLPFCVATLLLEGDVFVDQFARRRSSRGRRASRCCARSRSCTTPPSPRSAPAFPQVRLEAHFRYGAVAIETREAPRGREQSFASSDEIVEKFRKLTRAAMREPQHDALIEAVLGLEALEDAGELARLLRVG